MGVGILGLLTLVGNRGSEVDNLSDLMEGTLNLEVGTSSCVVQVGMI
jgi:hypothetical protein